VNGIHDMGGMHGFGPVVPERNEPVFHAKWERRMFAIALAMMSQHAFNVDEFRRTIERMPPHQYLAATYYERWMYACENLLIEKGVIERKELDVVMAAVREGASPLRTNVSAPDGEPGQKAASTGDSHEDASALSEALGGGARSLRHDESYRALFKAGDRVTARNRNPERHTRIPRYVRGRHGVIQRDWGVFIYPDTHAHGEGPKPQHCYAVEFNAQELWGSDHRVEERVYVDLWEDYLDTYLHIAAGADAKSQTNGGHKRLAKSTADVGAGKPARIRAVKKTRPNPHNA
jgi:nitrile hydratase beta subunit